MKTKSSKRIVGLTFVLMLAVSLAAPTFASARGDGDFGFLFSNSGGTQKTENALKWEDSSPVYMCVDSGYGGAFAAYVGAIDNMYAIYPQLRACSIDYYFDYCDTVYMDNWFTSTGYAFVDIEAYVTWGYGYAFFYSGTWKAVTP